MSEADVWAETMLRVLAATGDATYAEYVANKTGDAYRSRFGRRMPASDTGTAPPAPEPAQKPHEWDNETGTTCEVCSATVGSRAGDKSCPGKT